mmetsp:Transcript_8353/g.17408  ORF Transcript_8353/g.17408 Transcript_8353/m.17408 type:complete len:113 (-) Transcript_8353:1698-2036(-)
MRAFIQPTHKIHETMRQCTKDLTVEKKLSLTLPHLSGAEAAPMMIDRSGSQPQLLPVSLLESSTKMARLKQVAVAVICHVSLMREQEKSRGYDKPRIYQSTVSRPHKMGVLA